MHFHKYGPEHVYYNLANLPFAMTTPAVIFRGLDRQGHEHSYCYVAKPMRRFVADGQSVPLEKGFVFAVFVKKTLEIFDWRFERCDSNNAKYPENHKTRFGTVIWET